MTDQLIRKAAQRFLLEYGPVSRASVVRMLDDLDKGKATLKGGMTVPQAQEVLNLVAAISYRADPKRYESVGDIQNPAHGKAILESPHIQSPAIQRDIAQYAGEGEYTAALRQSGVLQHTAPQRDYRVDEQPAKDQQARYNQQQGQSMANNPHNAAEPGLALPDTEHYENVPAGEAPDYTIQQNVSGGYTRTSAGTGFYTKPKTRTGKIVSKHNSTGAAYVSGMNSGDSRQSQGARDQHNSVVQSGRVPNTSSSRGD